MRNKEEEKSGEKEEKATFPSQLKRKVLKEKKEKNSSPFIYLGYFLLVVALCILTAFTFRMIFLYKKSTFSTTSYSVLIKNKNPYIVSYNKELGRISYINLINFKPGSKTLQSLTYGVPLDGEVDTSVDIGSESFSTFPALVSFLVNQFSSRFTGLTILDLSNLIISTQSVPKNAIFASSVKITQDKTVEGLSQDDIYDAFKDSSIIEEALSVEVINATDVKGLAGGVSQILKNAGCNVIVVSSADSKTHSQLEAIRKSKTLERISHVLGIKAVLVEDLKSSADIRVIVGEDFVKNGDF